jgi:hypothetical protein
MEKIKGVELRQCWPSLSKQEMFTVIKQLCEYESKLFTTTFAQIGGLYYTDSLLPQKRGSTLKNRWCIGPIPKSSFWHGGRQHLQLDRGPCTPNTIIANVGDTPEKYLLSISTRERMWTKEFAKPYYRQLFFCKSKEPI